MNPIDPLGADAKPPAQRQTGSHQQARSLRMTPQVSVIIPAYNSVDYLPEAIRSVWDQTIEPHEVEIIVVDDGSTDGTAESLAEMASQDPRITVITQPNSGTAGGARNPAIGRAAGEFVFFLDSDDCLTPDALRRMVEVAHAEKSDVVLGKIVSSDARHAPSSMFKKTVLDADLLRDNVFNTLRPSKLIRREIIDRLELRFPEDQKVGEDQPFMAAVYLAASKISVLSDMDYYVIRHRTDGMNLTGTKMTASSHLTIAVRLAAVIEEYTSPGELRDGLLRRPFSWPMGSVLDGRWAKLGREEQKRLAEIFQNNLAHLYTEGARAKIAPGQRIALDLLAAERLDELHAYTSIRASSAEASVELSHGKFRRLLPPEIARLVREEDLVMGAPKMLCRLEGVRVLGTSVQVSASVRIPGLDGVPDSLDLRVRKRNSDQSLDLRTSYVDLSKGSRSFLVTAELDGFERGVWDAYAVVRFGEFEKEIRFGADRSPSIEPEGLSNLSSDPEPQDRTVVYYTQGPGNLSIDRGAVLHRNLGQARAVGLTMDEEGRAVLLVRTTSEPRPQDEYFGYLEGVRQHAGRHLLPSTRLGERLIGLRLPVTSQMIGATLEIAAVIDGVRTPLPVEGTAFWPARAAGFGLSRDEKGSLVVTTRVENGRDRYIPPALASNTPRLPTGGVGVRARAAIKRVPFIGSSLVRAVRRARRSRA